MEKELSTLTVDLAEVAKEINANIIFDFNSIKATLTQEDFDLLRELGFKTDVKTCMCYTCLKAGKTQDEATAFVQEAIESKKFIIHVSFEIPEEMEIPVISKENTPLLNELVQIVGSIPKEAFIKAKKKTTE